MSSPYEKLNPQERELACRTAMEVASTMINEVCGKEGSKVVKISEGEIGLSFPVPPEIVETNPLTVEHLMELPWSKGWSEGVLRMTHPEWEAYPAEKKEKLQRGLIEAKLLPGLQE